MEKDTCFSGFVKVVPPLLSVFLDDKHWQELCEKTRYVLPSFGVPATVENIRVWLNRLEIKESVYKEATQTSVADLIALNKNWPLRGLVGLLLEFIDKKNG